MKLHLYFARRFAYSFAMVFGIFLILFTLLDMVEQMRRFGSATVGFPQILRLSLLNVPSGIYQILPLIVVLATVVLYLSLARSSELIVSRAAGRSAIHSLTSPVLVSLLIGLLSVLVFNPIVAATSSLYEQVAASYRGEGDRVISVSREGLWLRQGSHLGQVVIRAARSNLDGTELDGVSFLGFGPDGQPSYRLEAQSAKLTPGAWKLSQAKQWQFKDSGNPEATAQSFEEFELSSNLTGEQIRDSFGKPGSIPIWDLPDFIEQLQDAGFSVRAYRVWFQMELALPLVLMAMVLVGAAFTMRHTRFGRTGQRVLMAVLIAFAFYFIRNFARVLGESGQLPVLLAAWAPPVAAILLISGILLHLEDG
jgi:lipopolysaccharide export system permease protein